MAADNSRGAMFRVIVPNQHSRVTNVELFFDLVFVFAVTQVSHTLLHHFTPLGAVHVTVLFLAVWWVWVYTAWVTNWLNPELTPVRVMLFLMMLGGLVLSTTIPTAFEGRGLWFAIAYAAMQLGRTAFWLFATPRHRTAVRHNAIRILSWLSISAVLWIAGGLSEGETRLWLWIAAVTWEYVSPAARFWVPKLGFSSVEAWAVEGGHMAERCSLFVIIALGEAVVVNGATFAELEWTADNIMAFVSALVGAIAMWWVYFHKGAEAGSERISKSAESGRLARLAYTYLHTPIIAGIILTAVSDELVLKHPTGHSDMRTVLSTIGGPLVFLIGTILFKHAIRGFLQLSHGIGIMLLLVLWWFAADLPPLWLSIASTVIMIVVAVWESVSLGADREEAKEH
ncbi:MULTISPECIES: low temperature requirement protein A [Bradyrhizobium]|uniref:Low temperature requirement protein A n=1 Tax=Bradyrhizobium ottawaense TaxID=931866 RepID=A0A2U8PBP6_9BRAD|nr:MULTISPECIES: low temperature requirement protein A [Bradyrhizobium]AWL95172.1 low temperature requirement protein A [Bradyrhizobium ottawaense]MBR1324787.1 low temperature requirement protein A [Bradyrhizobium ottawaense]MBR1336629.1 low temperature requirement protein A [Bradyrhizobium ottawaense]MDA9414853.1 membrane protein [Bradyrhizobium sp. CCBAU 25360]MDA9486899.1 membrane protein [Bradyrhizobium sp. CCBAU 11445]